MASHVSSVLDSPVHDLFLGYLLRRANAVRSSNLRVGQTASLYVIGHQASSLV